MGIHLHQCNIIFKLFTSKHCSDTVSYLRIQPKPFLPASWLSVGIGDGNGHYVSNVSIGEVSSGRERNKDARGDEDNGTTGLGSSAELVSVRIRLILLDRHKYLSNNTAIIPVQFQSCPSLLFLLSLLYV